MSAGRSRPPLVITQYTFGDYVSLSRIKTGGVACYHGYKYWTLEAERRELLSAEISSHHTARELGPFERADFGDRERLSWAGGACAIEQEAHLTFWGQRYAMWFEGAWLCAVDAARSTAVRLALPILVRKIRDALLVDGLLHLCTGRGVVVIAIADIEDLFQHTSGFRAVHVREFYPLRKPTAKVTMQVDWSWGSELSLKTLHDTYSSIRIPHVEDLDRGDIVTLHHLLAVDQYLEYSVGDGPRRPLYEHEFPPEWIGEQTLQVEPAIDPAGTLVRASTAVRTDDLDRVFGLLADEPDDEVSRMVVVDLLEDAGEPYAPVFAKLLAGDEGARADALGTLTSYLDQIEWHNNLPRAATLAATAPLDDEIGDLVLADHRLGFFESLRLGEGNFKLYSKLVASPRAVGLRQVDGSRVQTLKALIAAGRTGLRRLMAVKFVSRETIDALADPTFDRVVDVETEVEAGSVDRFLAYIERDEAQFFARAPRHLVLVERRGNFDALAQPVIAAWPKLPLDRLTVGDLTLSRDGVARVRPAPRR